MMHIEILSIRLTYILIKIDADTLYHMQPTLHFEINRHFAELITLFFSQKTIELSCKVD